MSWRGVAFMVIGAFIGYVIGDMFLPHYEEHKEPTVIAVSCPGSEPMLLENWEMHEGRITTKLDETLIVVPDNCWLFVMKGDKRKVASK